MVKVSIVITNYNYSKYLNRAIRSAFVQHYPEDKFEIIVVDDGSKDWSREIIKSYGRMIKAIYLEDNHGLAKARNVGILESRGDYILFLDGDDYLNRNIVLIESIYLDYNEDIDAVACDYFLIDEEENVIGRDSCEINPIACGIMFRKEKLIEIGMYDESFKMWEDKDLQIRFQKKYKIEYLKIPLYRYRRHNENLTNNKSLSKHFIEKLKNKHQ
jgi:glycosyltransferase involved in cell wall biosynthesis